MGMNVKYICEVFIVCTACECGMWGHIWGVCICVVYIHDMYYVSCFCMIRCECDVGAVFVECMGSLCVVCKYTVCVVWVSICMCCVCGRV